MKAPPGHTQAYQDYMSDLATKVSKVIDGYDYADIVTVLARVVAICLAQDEPKSYLARKEKMQVVVDFIKEETLRDLH